MLWKLAFMKAGTHKNAPKSTIVWMPGGTKEEQHCGDVDFGPRGAIFQIMDVPLSFCRLRANNFWWDY